MDVADRFDAQYEAFVMDDDATAPDEPSGCLYNDENGKIIVRATGHAKDDTKVVLEAIMAELELGAVVFNGGLDIGGSVSIEGSGGSVHSNGDLITGSPGTAGHSAKSPAFR